MIGMQQEYPVHGSRDDGVHLVVLTRGGEHHMQEVLRIAEIVAWIHERLALSILVAHGCQRGHLGDEPMGRVGAVRSVVDVQRVVIERRQRARYPTHDGHRVCIAPKALKEMHQLLVHHGVVADRVLEGSFLVRVGELPVEQQIAKF